jgi:predicted nucleotidyltransferase component of viral defense system
MSIIDLNYMPENTKKVFEKLSKSSFIDNYTLVGGTALSLQLNHRFSEDLDFIFDGEHLNINIIKRNINKLFRDYRIIKQDNNYQIDFIIEKTKVTFFSSGAVLIPFSVKKHSFKHNKLNIAKVDIIACLKMSAISQRNTIRDYYDLYYITKYHKKLDVVIERTKKLFPNLSPIIYTETLVYTDDISENDLSSHLNPKENITKEKIAEHFIIELKKTLK